MTRLSPSMLLMTVLLWPLLPAGAQPPASVQDPPVLDVLLVAKEVVPGRIVDVDESGAMRVAADGGQFELRLLNVVLPLADSTFRDAALSLLKERLLTRPIEVHIVTRPEEPDLAIGYPQIDGVDVRRELLAAALARYCRGDAAEPELEALEQTARDERRGIWSGEPVPACPGAARRR